MARAGWIGDYSDPQNFLFLGETDSAQLNYAHWSNADYDADMKKAAGERDLKARAKILGEAETILLREQPVMPLLFYASKNLISPKIKGWQTNILDRHPRAVFDAGAVVAFFPLSRLKTGRGDNHATSGNACKNARARCDSARPPRRGNPCFSNADISPNVRVSPSGRKIGS